MRSLIATAMLCVAAVAHAHDGHHDQWFESLKNGRGWSCCDGSDALRVEDPHWDVSGGRYRVFLDGKWIDVPEDRVVQAPNVVGPAFVWPVEEGGETHIRCFLPGAGA